MNIRRVRPLTSVREVAELLGCDGREIRGMVWAGYGAAIAGAAVARQVKKPEPWDDFVRSVDNIT